MRIDWTGWHLLPMGREAWFAAETRYAFEETFVRHSVLCSVKVIPMIDPS